MDPEAKERHRIANAKYREKNRERLRRDKRIAYMLNPDATKESNLMRYHVKKLLKEDGF
jgi:t-SNARE complex subunit (syntaxin)